MDSCTLKTKNHWHVCFTHFHIRLSTVTNSYRQIRKIEERKKVCQCTTVKRKILGLTTIRVRNNTIRSKTGIVDVGEYTATLKSQMSVGGLRVVWTRNNVHTWEENYEHYARDSGNWKKINISSNEINTDDIKN